MVGDDRAFSNKNSVKGELSYVSCFIAWTNWGRKSMSWSLLSNLILLTANRRTSLSGKLDDD